ncbi:MAG: response regulator transcription factor [Aquisalimonadaceae bacterium]
MGRLLLVEDDADLRGSMCDYLTLKGYEVAEAATGDCFRQNVLDQRFDLVLLDLNLPDADGLQLLREARQGSDAPVFVVSGRSHDGSRLSALDMGADDYIVKPFNIRELEFRIRNFLRRQRERLEQETLRWQFGAWTLDAEQRKISDSEGRPVHVTRGEFDVLYCLVQAQGAVVSWDGILGTLEKNGLEVSLESLPVLVSRLRRKFSVASDQQLIDNLPGIGYRIAAPVSRA